MGVGKLCRTIIFLLLLLFLNDPREFLVLDFSIIVCHFLPGDIGGRGYPEKVTNGDMGDRGVQKLPFLR